MDELINFYIATLSKGTSELFSLPAGNKKDVLSDSEDDLARDLTKESPKRTSSSESDTKKPVASSDIIELD